MSAKGTDCNTMSANINPDMTPRRQAVLGLIIRSYVDRGIPVGSKMFVQSYGLDISAATIRNEMAALEDLGYLTHPHTSAGRTRPSRAIATSWSICWARPNCPYPNST